MRFPLIAALLLCASLAGGCANPKQQLLDTRKGFNLALQTVNAGHAAGLITVDQKRALQPYVLATQAALDAGDAEIRQAQLATAAGDTSAASTLMKSAKTYAAAAIAALRKMNELMPAVAKTAPPPVARLPPTTAPAR